MSEYSRESTTSLHRDLKFLHSGIGEFVAEICRRNLLNISVIRILLLCAGGLLCSQINLLT